MMVDPEELDAFLAHHGVKGMRWGVRKEERGGVSRKTDREARKDAQEHARAKQFHGEGAGTRRKLSKATVEGKSKRDADYAKAFARHLANQNEADHARGAKKERTSIDRRTKAKQRTGFIARKVTGEMGTQAAFTALLLGGAAFASSEKGRRLMKTGMDKIESEINNQKRKAGIRRMKDFLDGA